MNRIEFMSQLERLLQNISPAEREEALQYYNDYFNDAGVENEQDVIEALGNPAKVAETIKRDLYGSDFDESVFGKAADPDKAVVKYEEDVKGAQQDADGQAMSPDENGGENGSPFGQNSQGGQSPFGQNSQGGQSPFGQNSQGGQSPFGQNSQGDQSPFGQNSQGGQSPFGQNSQGGQSPFGQSGQGGQSPFGQGTGGYYGTGGAYGGTGSYQQTGWGSAGQQTYSGSYSETAVKEEKKTSTGMIVLIVVLCVLLSPIVLSVAGGIISGAFGLLAGWFGMIIGFGLAAVILLFLMITLIGVGVAGMFASPIGGIGLIGGGLLCGGIGILFMMLTIAMAGIATPAIFRGIRALFRKLTGRRKYA